MERGSIHSVVTSTLSAPTAAGTAGATSKNLCTQQCAAPQPIPVTPNVLKTPNFWRGNMISKDYQPGEYDFDFKKTSVTVTFGTGANKDTYTADVSSMQVDGALEVDGVRYAGLPEGPPGPLPAVESATG